MNNQKLIALTADFVKNKHSSAEGGHDWWHTHRVWQNSIRLAQSYGDTVNHLVIELAALLHDIADAKFHDGDEEIGPKTAEMFLSSYEVSQEISHHVVEIVRYISFKNDFDGRPFNSIELQIVQDADRLDAIGAVGIARAFSFGGHRGNPLYVPNVSPHSSLDKAAYMKRDGPTINHFYEKLLLLKDRMNTQEGKKMAIARHQFMEQFLHQFFQEINPLK